MCKKQLTISRTHKKCEKFVTTLPSNWHTLHLKDNHITQLFKWYEGEVILKNEISQWIYEYCNKDWAWNFVFQETEYPLQLHFVSPQVAVLFKLTWM